METSDKSKNVLVLVLLVILSGSQIFGCLITNCPRGGKRSGKFSLSESGVKPCITCGPARSGQCFGPNICCGPFGCLLGTAETMVCKRDGYFQEIEPCIAGNSSCRKNTGRCAAEGLCCNQESCHSDKTCSYEEKLPRIPLEFYNLFNYQNQDFTSEK